VADESNTSTLDNLLSEDRTFPPPAELAAAANVDESAYAQAEADSEAFWAE
jgi:acetyl-CoA synthetase